MRRRRGIRIFCILSTALLCVSPASPAAPVEPTTDTLPLSFKAIPLSSADARESRVGALIYRGGIEVTSSDRRFGGWSGLLVSRDGTALLSVSDKGHWLRAHLAYSPRGELVSISNSHLADMKGLNGRELTSKFETDAEGLAALTDKGLNGAVAVSFERYPRIWQYDSASTLDAVPTPVAAPDAIKALPYNSGLEPLTKISPHLLLIVTETPVQRAHHRAWLVPIPGHKAAAGGELSIAQHDPYEISDAALSPDGPWLYLLEHHYFGRFGGVAAAIRRIDAATVKPGARLDGEEIARFTMHENIDNMEGLALRRDASGRTLLYMISDDNYDSARQRTVLLMFEVADAG